ncbi:MAG: type III-B CRISPR-associated protein Cas10/Cmr2 [Nostocales cyanobacterium 94392]|nr:type III-B CRISPR-associated protein Cas10/Cmr2 [Nostocales cyanobacterium 94392]
MVEKMDSISIGIAWCLAWGEEKKPKYDLEILKRMREALQEGKEDDIPQELSDIVDAVRELDKLEDINQFPKTLDELKKLTEKHPLLWNSHIGLVYGGATKIKQYVFEESKLPDIRGASTRLDQINLIDLPTFFHEDIDNRYTFYIPKVNEWIQKNYPQLTNALIPELIIYSCGGNILAFCPTAYIDILSNTIEKRYTERTITANSCAVGDSFRFLELRFGLLRENIKDTFWLEKYRDNYENDLVEGVFGKIEDTSKLEENFQNHKSFNELTTKLAILFNQRRSGNDTPNRPSRRYPPMLETHPYLRRDETEKRLAITKATNLIGEPYLSETTAIKRQIGDKAKNGRIREINGYEQEDIKIDLICENWIEKFEKFLENNTQLKQKYFGDRSAKKVKIAESLTQLGKVSKGFVAYIYADGNNMGGYIQKIRTAKKYQNFSQDVDKATRYTVFQALADNLHPRQVQGIQDESKSNIKNDDFIHPFEIITIGGDDIIIIVPADKALEIAKDIGENFENILLGNLQIQEQGKNLEIRGNYLDEHYDGRKAHRCHQNNKNPEKSNCKLSISSGVLITAYNTPIYYAEDLTKQLMKSAKDYAKKLHFKDKDNKTDEDKYYGGTVDFLVMKSVTMVSSSVKDFRENALTKKQSAEIKLYAAPYTLYELGGLVASIKALIAADFPKSQLYQIRDFLSKGRRTASLNYYYFRTRLKQGKSQLREDFETAWCHAKTNGGNIAPWMYENRFNEKYYETIWREMVDLYEFMKTEQEDNGESKQTAVNISNTSK